MSVRLDDAVIYLEGASPVEDAETLLALLVATPGRTIALGHATHLHAAVVQILLALRPVVAGVPPDPFLARWLLPLLMRDASG